MEITARLAEKGEVKQFESGFITQNFFLDATRFNQQTGEKYSNYLKFQNNNEKIDLSPLELGDLVKVTFSLRGRFFANSEGGQSHIQSLEAYKLEVVKRNADLPPLDYAFNESNN